MYCVLDFESDAIDTRPNYPPEPCGLAVYIPSKITSFYFAWGHPTENNCLKEDATKALKEMLKDSEGEFVFHNAPFDCAIIEEKLGLEVPWDRVHDTMLLAFLTDPFGELSLKPLCENLLGMPPDEQDAVRNWLVSHGVCRANDKGWGAYISRAPGNLVGTYAIGDVIRTWKLFEYYQAGGKSVQEQRMAPKVTYQGAEVVWATGSVPPEAYKSGDAPW